MTRLVADTGVYADPGAFGVDTRGLTGQLSNLGGDLAQVAQNQAQQTEYDRRKAEREAEHQQTISERLTATKELSSIRTKYIEQFSAGAAETPEKFNENYQKVIESAMKGKEAWLPETRASLEESLYNLGSSLVDNNLRNLAKVELKGRQDDFISTLQNFGEAAKLDGNFSSAREATKTLKTQAGSSVGVAGDKAYLQALTDLDIAEVTKASETRTPGVAASELRAKKIAPDMDDLGRASLAVNLDREEEAQAETNLNSMRDTVASLQASATAGDSSALLKLEGANKTLEAAQKRFDSSRKPVADQDASLISQINTVVEKGKAAGLPEAQLSSLRSQLSLSTAAAAMKGASPKEVNDVVQRRIDKFGPGSTEAAQANEIARAAIANLNKDPFTYVLQDPGLQNQFAKIQSDGSPEKFQALLGTITSRQQRYGVSQPAVMSSQEADQIAGRFQKMAAGIPVDSGNGITRKYTPDELVQSIDMLTNRYGKFASQALSNLTTLPAKENQLPVELQVIAAIPASNSIVRAQLAQSLDESPAAEGRVKTAFDVKVDKINNELASSDTFQKFSTSLWFSTPDNGRVQTEQWGEAISRQAQRLMYTGQAKSEKEAVKKATDMVVSSVWDIQDGLRIPRAKGNGESRDTVATSRSLDGLKGQLLPQLDVMRWAPSVPGMDEKRREILGQKKVASVLAWITSEDGTGAALVATDNLGQLSPMFTKDGRQVVIDFDRVDSIPAPIAHYTGEESPVPNIPPALTGLNLAAVSPLELIRK